MAETTWKLQGELFLIMDGPAYVFPSFLQQAGNTLLSFSWSKQCSFTPRVTAVST
jgi:hypothetical protein